MGKIITISGVSCSGKTTLRDYLFLSIKNCRLIESVTARAPRERDRNGEFFYISEEEFAEKEKWQEFLLATPPIHGARYGTLKRSIDDAVASDATSLMVITIDSVPDLVTYAGDRTEVTALHILSPGPKILRERMIKRGETLRDIEQRVSEGQDWDFQAQMLRTDHPILLISNNENLVDFFIEAKTMISSYGAH